MTLVEVLLMFLSKPLLRNIVSDSSMNFRAGECLVLSPLASIQSVLDVITTIDMLARQFFFKNVISYLNIYNLLS